MSSSEAVERLKQLSGWALDGQAIRRQFTFDGFRQAVAFVVRMGFDAEEADHHPDILITYRRVTLTFTTHSEGGLTGKDFDGAARATEIASTMGGK